MPVDCESEFDAMAKRCGELIVHRYRVTATRCSELGLEYVPWITRASVNTTHNVTTGEKERKNVCILLMNAVNFLLLFVVFFSCIILCSYILTDFVVCYNKSITLNSHK